jgi:hypothetical protein
LEGKPFPAQAGDGIGHALCRAKVNIGGQDIRSLLRELHGDRLAKAPARTGNDRGFVG